MAAEEKAILVYGNIDPFPTPKGWYHASTYLEYEIPKKIEKKLSKIIEKEIKDFKKKCKCKGCKKQRKKK